jgi:hypothetical protein
MRLANRIWRTRSRTVGALVMALLVAACGSADKAPAEAAIKTAEAALAGVKSDAAKFVPDQLKPLEDTLAAAKASFDKGDYTAALGGAKDVAAKATNLASAVAAKKAELTQTWASVSAGVPKMTEALQSRVDILSQSKKLPAGLDKGKLDDAKAGLATAKQTWADASAAYSAGNIEDAVSKARSAQNKAAEAMTALNMQVPAAARQ